MDADESFELMDVDSGNLVGSFATEAEAVAAVRAAYARFGDEGVRDLLLIRVDPHGEHAFVADGEALVTMLTSSVATV